MPPETNPYSFLPPVPAFRLRSDDIADGQALGVAQRSGIFGGPGQDRSPHLAWEGQPLATQSFVVTCYDADAPTASGFWHWAVLDIPATVTELAADAGHGSGAGLPDGARTLANDAGQRRFLGAAPPPGHGPHRYYFVVHALDTSHLDIDASATPAWLGFQLYGHTLARATLTPTSQTPA
ncbi:YbhB/YbcL family Raf kinase inhibitor-like protein [Streptomyces sp. NPDC056192]|uniref:YbhB/YbcL family Raf kinase inhibitor-like protein n=1 Tax=Streptomyces sp. NPDC056192 TaxID=3345743 RepID=UPI0035DCB006